MKILIFFANYGSGHERVALNLKDILYKHDVGMYNAKRMDHKYMTYGSEYIYNNIVTKNASSKLIKKGFDVGFKITDKSEFFSHFFVKKSGYKSIDELINKENADIVITTFPYYVKKPKIPIITIITDYGFSNIWYDKNIHYYFIAHDKIKDDLIKKGVNSKDIYLTGIPVAECYYSQNNSLTCSNILFNLGARGQFSKQKLVKNINFCLEMDKKISIICGKNEKLYNFLKKKFKGNKQIYIYEFVSNMHEIISLHDLVITKAGGLSVTECVASEKPMIIDTDESLDSQEKFNCDYVHDNQIGYLSSEKEIFKVIKYVDKNPLEYQKMINNLKKIKKHTINSNINGLIEEIYEKKRIEN